MSTVIISENIENIDRKHYERRFIYGGNESSRPYFFYLYLFLQITEKIQSKLTSMRNNYV